jgi:hypothetical protein
MPRRIKLPAVTCTATFTNPYYEFISHAAAYICPQSKVQTAKTSMLIDVSVPALLNCWPYCCQVHRQLHRPIRQSPCTVPLYKAQSAIQPSNFPNRVLRDP